MSNVQIYTKSYCPYCISAKHMLKKIGVAFEEIEISTDRALQTEMRERSQRRTVPQIFVGDIHIGGSDDLRVAMKNGQFSEALAKASTVN